MAMRNKGPLSKRKVLSVRVTDSEMGEIQELMEVTRLSASELLREALLSFARRPHRARAA
jgi:hypothetical protein